MFKKVIQLFLFCLILPILNGIVYFSLTQLIFNIAISKAQYYASMKPGAIAVFIALLLINVMLFITIKKRNAVFSWVYIVSAEIINIVLLLVMASAEFHVG